MSVTETTKATEACGNKWQKGPRIDNLWMDPNNKYSGCHFYDMPAAPAFVLVPGFSLLSNVQKLIN